MPIRNGKDSRLHGIQIRMRSSSKKAGLAAHPLTGSTQSPSLPLQIIRSNDYLVWRTVVRQKRKHDIILRQQLFLDINVNSLQPAVGHWAWDAFAETPNPCSLMLAVSWPENAFSLTFHYTLPMSPQKLYITTESQLQRETQEDSKGPQR